MKPGRVLVGYPKMDGIDAALANAKLDRITQAILGLYRVEVNDYRLLGGPYVKPFIAECLADIRECRQLIHIAVKEHRGSWM